MLKIQKLLILACGLLMFISFVVFFIIQMNIKEKDIIIEQVNNTYTEEKVYNGTTHTYYCKDIVGVDENGNSYTLTYTNENGYDELPNVNDVTVIYVDKDNKVTHDSNKGKYPMIACGVVGFLVIVISSYSLVFPSKKMENVVG